jgi:hypothetical protein
VTTTATSYTPSTALDAATTYYWEVQALPSGSGQNAFWSSVSSFTTGNPDFSLSASPSTLAISPGNSGTSTLTLTPINNFSATPNLTCSASSSLAGVTCTVGPLGGNNTATVTITASSAATSYPALPRNPRFGAWWVAGVAMLCHLLIALCRLRQGSVPAFCRAERRSAQGQRRWPLHVWLRPEAALWNLRLAAIGAILAALLVASLSCGGGSSGGGGGTTAPPPESGAVTVTGTSSTLSHTAQVSVSVS